MCASDIVRLPLRRLQTEQAATTLIQVVCPPRERGTRWSKVRSSSAPQYWQANLSGRKTLDRGGAGGVGGVPKGLRDTTLGSFISKPGRRTALSDNRTMLCSSRRAALLACG